MAVDKKQQAEAQNEHLDTYQQIEKFFIHNRNIIIGVIVVIAASIGGYFGYKKLYIEPREQEAENKIASPQAYFSQDSMRIALNGDSVNIGFLSIIDRYGNTPTGNLAKYYAGVCYLQMQDFDNAIRYLSDYDPKTDMIAGKTYELLGHAYAEKKDYSKATDYYKKAGESANNDLQSPYYYKLAGDLMSDQGNLQGALDMYQKIKKEYPLSTEGQNIDLDISYIQTKLKK